MGCTSFSFLSKASAGGQLEQPSEVNNSTSTGVRAGGRESAAPTGRITSNTASDRFMAIRRVFLTNDELTRRQRRRSANYFAASPVRLSTRYGAYCPEKWSRSMTT